MIGSRIAHYKIIDKLGAGGMGEVFLAEDTKLERKVALKFLPPHFGADLEFKSRFQHEAKATAALDHPNIVTVHELGEHEGRLYIAMQHVEGQTLAQRISTQTLTIPHAIDIVGQLCEGLASAHQAGIVHRDIKPANILIDPTGRVRILDFGLAKSYRATTETKVGSTLGTVQYESPEQSRGEDVDQRSDLFSVGVVLYEMITGKLPFTGEYEESIRYSISHEEPDPIARFKSGTSDELQRIISKLLEKDPSVRYQSAEGVLSDLRKLAGVSAIHHESQFQTPPSKKPLALVAVGLLVIVAVLALMLWPRDQQAPVVESEPERKMLAILPFENLGSPDDEYFADGITDEITSKVAMLKGLGVIARTSILQYKGTTKRIQEIGAELGVDYILEGTIRWDKSGDTARVRITPQLIKVSDETHLWAANIERPLTQIFAVQSDIASSITEALGIALVGREKQELKHQQTASTEAFDYYLQGNKYAFGGGETESSLRSAKTLYLKALELDTTFAAAYARLSRVYIELWYHYGKAKSDSATAKLVIDKAATLDSDLLDVHFGLWAYYFHLEDYERALIELNFALEMQPGNSDLLMAISATRRRQGKWNAAIKAAQDATVLDPRSTQIRLFLGFLHSWNRDWEEGEGAIDRAIALEPDNELAHIQKAWLYIERDGDPQSAVVHLKKAGQMGASLTDFKESKMFVAEFTNSKALIYAMAGDYDRALEGFSSITDGGNRCRSLALVNQRLGNRDLARIYYDSALIFIEKKVAENPRDPVQHSKLGIVYAGLGQKEVAVREGKLAVEMAPLAENHIHNVNRIDNLARIYVYLGEYDNAVDQLETLLSISSYFSVGYLRVSFIFNPLRGHPSFEALLAKYET